MLEEETTWKKRKQGEEQMLRKKDSRTCDDSYFLPSFFSLSLSGTKEVFPFRQAKKKQFS